MNTDRKPKTRPIMVVAAGAVAFGIARGRQLTVTARGQHLQVQGTPA